jgi:TPR repeat protein
MWYRRAADHGNAAAMTDLALLHIRAKASSEGSGCCSALQKSSKSCNCSP